MLMMFVAVERWPLEAVLGSASWDPSKEAVSGPGLTVRTSYLYKHLTITTAR
jgi:hypothetical protein